jgi:3-(3-hydroxy-phenyl)propionate hydroxylase
VTLPNREVVVVGAGPTGLMLAAELALAGVDVALVERRPSQELAGARAGGLHARTLEILDQRGVVDRFIAAGKIHPALHFQVPLDMSDFPTRHNYVLGLPQPHIERLLAAWVGELGIPVHRNREVRGFVQDAEGVDVDLGDGPPLRARYLVGCDGGRSCIRKAAGIEFAGCDATTSWLLAEVECSSEPQWGFRDDAHGRTHAIARMDDGKRARMALTEAVLGPESEPTLADVAQTLRAAYGTDFGVHSPTWLSRFTDATRQVAAYRDRRVLLAGDAAHVHPPFGGQGLNVGVQDAANLGWKLAQVVKATAPESLLDTYHAERHPVGARVLRNTMAQGALRRADERTKALAEYVAGLLRMDGPRRRVAAEISGLDIRYGDDAGHPLMGRRMPDLEVVTAAGARRVYSLLHDARPLLLNLGAARRLDIGPWADRVRLVDAKYAGEWELPVIGAVPAAEAVLVRPDGYVAWVEPPDAAGLRQALERWFGPPRPAWP